MSADTAASTEAPAAPTIRDGGCAGCTLCCKVMRVPSLAKASGVWCPHCTMGIGCGIYETRPTECRNFICGFLTMPELGEEWRPANSRLIIDTQKEDGTLLVYVDPSRPDAWKKQPYYAQLQGWARWALAHKQRVIVRSGSRTIVVLPDQAVDFGPVMADEVLVVFGVSRPGGGSDYRAFAAKAEMWAKIGLEVQEGRALPSEANGFRSGKRVG
jgi:hypothetical protein